ncbi:MAG: aminotransferase class I/II-fold pyridoxal phosphate-dependent enzyme [Verrucomicrobia bacterium]|nr:aminotransferase class I/II-fold pyridoxal phosphate-dependent enzyme [Verrucomicrobiota bacterium]
MRRKKGTLRELRVVENSKETLNLANNDYLNLRKNGRLAQAANEATLRSGASASASPLITGYTAIHAALEAEIRDWYAMPQALLWNSGYAANQAVLSLIIQPGDLVLADRHIHNSLINGILKSKARLIRFPHNNLEALES